MLQALVFQCSGEFGMLFEHSGCVIRTQLWFCIGLLGLDDFQASCKTHVFLVEVLLGWSLQEWDEGWFDGRV